MGAPLYGSSSGLIWSLSCSFSLRQMGLEGPGCLLSGLLVGKLGSARTAEHFPFCVASSRVAQLFTWQLRTSKRAKVENARPSKDLVLQLVLPHSIG